MTKFYHRHLAPAQATAMEPNPPVIVAARSMFGLPFDDARLSVFEQDAYDWVANASHHSTVDALQIDLYDATARGLVLDTPAFYKACRQALRSPGVMTISLFGDHIGFPRNIKCICDTFDNRVLILPEVHGGNVIALAFNGPPLQVSWEAVQARAAALQASLELPTKGWVDDLRDTNAGQENVLSI